MAQPCSDAFSIDVRGGEFPCEITVDTDDKNHSFDVEDIPAGKTLTVGFSYKIGKPKRTVFASSYTKSAIGRTRGSAPDLGARSFSKQPDASLDPAQVDFAEFSVGIPPYSDASDDLGTGIDAYTITLWMREPNVRIGGTSPPANLEPPNPA